MNNAGGDLKEIKVAVNSITAHLMSKSTRHEGSILTAYADDDRAVWKEFRRELLEDGFSSSVIRKHKGLIKAYIEELGSRGLLDEDDPNEEEEEESLYRDFKSTIEGATAHDSNSQSKSEAPPRPKAEVELPVRSEPPLDFNTMPEAHSNAESGNKETPLHDPIPRIDSQPEFKTDLRWIWLSHENNGKNQQSPAEGIRASEVEHGPSTTAIDGDRDRSSDVRDKPRGEVGTAGEDDGTDNEAEEISDSRRRRSRVAFTRDATIPPPWSPFTKSEQEDKEMTRLFYDTWHDIHDVLALKCIEWLSLSILPMDSKNLVWKYLLLNQIQESKLSLGTSKYSAGLIVRQQELISDLQSMQKAIEWFPGFIRHREFSQDIFEDRRSEGKGYGVKFDMSWAWGVVVSTGARCSLCPPS